MTTVATENQAIAITPEKLDTLLVMTEEILEGLGQPIAETSTKSKETL